MLPGIFQLMCQVPHFILRCIESQILTCSASKLIATYCYVALAWVGCGQGSTSMLASPACMAM